MNEIEIKRRNAVFKEYMDNVVDEGCMLYGTIHVPRVVRCIDDKYHLMPIFVNNYDIIMLDNSIGGTQVGKFYMGYSVSDDNLRMLKHWYSKEYPSKRVYFIKYLDTDLFLTKDEVDNCILNNNESIRTPLFGLSNHAIFINYKDAMKHKERFSPSINSKLIIV